MGYAEDVGELEQVRDKALANAKGKIANALFEETEVERIFTTSGSLSGDEELRRNYRENVKSTSAVRLSGIEIADQHTEITQDAGLSVRKVWVLARISRKAFESERSRIVSELRRKLALVDDNLRRAEQQLASGRALDAVNAYVSAAISSVKVKERAEEFPIYMNEAGQALSRVLIEPGENPRSLDISSGGDFVFNVLYATEQGRRPVPGAKVRFVVRNNSGEHTQTAVSDKNGSVVCRITRLNEANASTLLTARLSLDFQEILDAGPEAKKHYTTLMDRGEKIFATSEFRTVSSVKRGIPTTVVSMTAESGGSYSPLPALSSEAQSAVIAKGYKVVKFPGGIPLAEIAEARSSALRQLASGGVSRVLVLIVSADQRPAFNADIDRYAGVYTLSLQMVDTQSGEVLTARNIRQSATSATEKGVLDSFVKAAGSQIRRLID